MGRPKTARTFTISLKPMYQKEEIEKIVKSLTGTAKVYAINHDKDEDTEPHTHFLIDYSTPRYISTVANIFGVEGNFVEIVRNKKGMLRYLIHLDDKDKYQYKPEEVISNDKTNFNDILLGDTLTDREIAEYITKGKGYELLGIVPAGKLRTIQAFLHFDNTGRTLDELKEIKRLKKLNDAMYEVIEKIEIIALTEVHITVANTEMFELIADIIEESKVLEIEK